jgi:SAM-dependent methyltransferase
VLRPRAIFLYWHIHLARTVRKIPKLVSTGTLLIGARVVVNAVSNTRVRQSLRQDGCSQVVRPTRAAAECCCVELSGVVSICYDTWPVSWRRGRKATNGPAHWHNVSEELPLITINLTQVTPRSFAAGILSFLPVVRALTCGSSGGTGSARYCYSVWMRHLVKAHNAGIPTNPVCVAELGPGDSVGIGLASILTGVGHYIALDAKSHANTQRNLAILDELHDLFVRRAAIPTEDEFPNIQPKIESSEFPAYILTTERLASALAPSRIQAVRRAILGQASQVCIEYKAPWSDRLAVSPKSVDLIFSQAVLEHVDDLEQVYESMKTWLKPGGYLSHSVDFKCHGLTRDWNGHWEVSDLMWKLVRGTRPYLINREPASRHLELLTRNGFVVVSAERKYRPVSAGFRPSKSFRRLQPDDIKTASMFIQAVLSTA